jgi:hypothetical protein
MYSGDVLQLHFLAWFWYAALSLHILPTAWQKRFHHRLMNHLHPSDGIGSVLRKRGLDLGAWDDV